MEPETSAVCGTFSKEDFHKRSSVAAVSRYPSPHVLACMVDYIMMYLCNLKRTLQGLVTFFGGWHQDSVGLVDFNTIRCLVIQDLRM